MTIDLLLDLALSFGFIVLVVGSWLIWLVISVTFTEPRDVVDEVEAEHRYIDAVNRL